MKFNIWTLLFQVINFVILLYILRRILYKPIREIIEKRRGLIAKTVEDAENTKKEALELKEKNQKELNNAKELQSIVDYSRSPATTNSAALDPVFNTTVITDEGGSNNYPFYWTGTTHENRVNGSSAVYIAIGEALGWMESPSGDYTLMDVHGAGAQRSDPKLGDPSDYPYGHGPQGDVIRIYNYVRCVRSGL